MRAAWADGPAAQAVEQHAWLPAGSQVVDVDEVKVESKVDYESEWAVAVAAQRVSEVNHNCRVYDFRRVLGWESTGKQCIVSFVDKVSVQSIHDLFNLLLAYTFKDPATCTNEQ